ncbi:MAG: hypothetical protein IJU41_03530 [Clostridia bacterium]|nr:hypothetical protein [Clostridia bacterium]
MNNTKLKIATGTGRKAKRWKNVEIPWSDFVDRLRTPVVTNETVAEYRAMSRERQSEIKDVGGFVAGYLSGGDRSKVKSRSMITLDADFADGTLWDAYCLAYDSAAVLYSTHKHTPENMRLRLVIPLSRDVTPDEYGAIARRVADDIGIEFFDDTTYQPGRLMYWPSRSRDGQYVFTARDGDFLDPDEVLATYPDWRDISAWPTSSRVAEIEHRSAEKQQDPLAKPGLVGVFCRTYTIEEAIAAFVPAYTPAGDRRYTYAAGSTAAGVVVYDNKFIYSHHATDPCSLKLCNAWDMVRLHRFGALDADADAGTAVSKLPSYRAMQAFALADDHVKQVMLDERAAAAKDDFEDLDGTDWKKKLELTEKGGLRQSIGNAVLILLNDPALKGSIAYDEFNCLTVVRKDLPWRAVGDRRGSSWQNSDESELRYYIETHYGSIGKEKITDAVEVVAHKQQFHPIRDYLAAQVWDGKARLDELLIRYLGAADTPYTRAVTRKTFTAAVARVFNPGCKFDYMLTIKGSQGLGKSSLLYRLAGDWFSDSLTAMQGKEAYEQLRRVWIAEFAEMSFMKKSDIEPIKQFITKQTDQYRPAYGRVIEVFPRQCIFIGTVNGTAFLRDPTGNRRFWVVDTGTPRADFRRELTDDVVGQIWAEAVVRYRAGEPLYLDDKLEETAGQVRESFTETDDRQGLVEGYLARKLPKNWNEMDIYARREWLASDSVGCVERTRVCRMEIWCEVFGGAKGKIDRLESKAIDDMLTRLGWYPTGNAAKFGIEYDRQREYCRVE